VDVVEVVDVGSTVVDVDVDVACVVVVELDVLVVVSSGCSVVVVESGSVVDDEVELDVETDVVDGTVVEEDNDDDVDVDVVPPAIVSGVGSVVVVESLRTIDVADITPAVGDTAESSTATDEFGPPTLVAVAWVEVTTGSEVELEASSSVPEEPSAPEAPALSGAGADVDV